MNSKLGEKESMSECATISTVSVDDVVLETSSCSNQVLEVGLPHTAQEAGKTEYTSPEYDVPEVKVIIKENKQPRRILHFSDGVLEEYSTDEDEVDEAPKTVIDPKSLTWSSWVWYYTTLSASKLLGAADSCGEKLAWFFGITSPKYQYAIDEYYKMKEEEEEDRRRQEREDAADWAHVNHAMSQESIISEETITSSPHSIDSSKDQSPIYSSTSEAKF